MEKSTEKACKNAVETLAGKNADQNIKMTGEQSVAISQNLPHCTAL